jgi:hypothetical protein
MKEGQLMKLFVLTAAILIGFWTNDIPPAHAESDSSRIVADSTPGKTTVRPGKQIRLTNLAGYTLTYHLMDLSERGEMLKLMGHHDVLGLSKSPDVTNHLMVYIQNPAGKLLLGEVAYHLTGPDGKDFKTMSMAMYGGYGADMIMKLKGPYTIRMKFILEGGVPVKLDDEFAFQIK